MAVVQQIAGLLGKSREAAEPVAKIGYFVAAERLFEGLCSEDGNGFRLSDTGQAKAVISGMRAEYEAAGFFTWPGAELHLARLSKIYSSKLGSLRKPPRRRSPR